MTMYLRYAARSDRGLVRANNQDSVFAGPRLLAVADGMGGHVGGEVASKIVIAAIEYLDADDPGGDMLQALREGVQAGTLHLREMVEEQPNLDGMGTTLTAMLFNGKRIGLCHVGDSRAYLFRGDTLHQITHDDTFVQALIDEGRITQEEADVHPQRSVILRALNGVDVEPDLSIREGRDGDRYLLCSDGLSSFVSAERIEKVLRTSSSPADAADSLIDFALRAGGPDNITVIVADLIDDDDGDTVDGTPVVDGAAGGNRGQREARGDSPAARAALIGKRAEPTEEAAPQAEAAPEKPHRKRRWWVLLAVLVILVAGVIAARAYIGSRYFVGVNGDQVVIFNGVNAEVGPWTLYSVEEQTDYKLSDLQAATRVTISEGVTADSLQNAREIVARLDNRLLPLCPEPPAETTAPPVETTTGPAPAMTAAPNDTQAPTTDGNAPPADATNTGGGAAGTSAEAPTEQPTDCRPRR